VKGNQMKLYHSGSEMTEISNSGRFGSFLFFLPENDCNYGTVSYSIEIDESAICDYSDIKSAMYDDDSYLAILSIIKEAASKFDIDEEEAAEMLSGDSENLIGDDNAAMQVFQGRTALALGYEALRIEDEFSGDTVMIGMAGRFAELNRM
jgi:hypothetical protein